MSRYAWLAVSAAAASGGVATAASDQQMVCGQRQHLVSHLGRAYSEQPANVGVAATGNLIEVLTSSGGTWTILVTDPKGVTCVVAAGESWESVPRVAAGPGA